MVLRSEILVNKNVLPTKEQALPGRETPIKVPDEHFVNKNPLLRPVPRQRRIRHLRPGLLLGRGTPLLAT